MRCASSCPISEVYSLKNGISLCCQFFPIFVGRSTTGQSMVCRWLVLRRVGQTMRLISPRRR